jgi:hypothetical protein
MNRRGLCKIGKILTDIDQSRKVRLCDCKSRPNLADDARCSIAGDSTNSEQINKLPAREFTASAVDGIMVARSQVRHQRPIPLQAGDAEATAFFSSSFRHLRRSNNASIIDD